MIFCYNPQAVGDVLLVVVGNSRGEEVIAERNGNVTKVMVKATKEIVAWNIFNISQVLPELNGNGQVNLTEEQVEKVNQEMKNSGFSEVVCMSKPKIVTGFVKECQEHPDSDHLSITQTEVGNGEILQIVCGAPNIQAGLKVVVAKPGAMMPDGLMIWPGKLRGEESHGMICSARELRILNAPQKKGILELPIDTKIGEPFVVKT